MDKYSIYQTGPNKQSKRVEEKEEKTLSRLTIPFTGRDLEVPLLLALPCPKSVLRVSLFRRVASAIKSFTKAAIKCEEEVLSPCIVLSTLLVPVSGNSALLPLNVRAAI